MYNQDDQGRRRSARKNQGLPPPSPPVDALLDLLSNAFYPPMQSSYKANDASLTFNNYTNADKNDNLLSFNPSIIQLYNNDSNSSNLLSSTSSP